MPVVRMSPGMVLTEPIADGEGRLLAGPGTVVTAQLLRRLRLRGIMTVEAPRSLPNRAAWDLPVAEAALFAADERDAFMRELARLTAQRHV